MCKCNPGIKTPFCGRPGCEWPEHKIEAVSDPISEKIDEMADLCEYWKRNRDKGRNPTAVRSALLMLAGEVSIMANIKAHKANVTGLAPGKEIDK